MLIVRKFEHTLIGVPGKTYNSYICTIARMVCVCVCVIAFVWYRQDKTHRHHFKALIVSAVLQLPLFLTEILIAVNIDSGGVMPWRSVFTPLYLLTILSIPSCIWACWRKRTYEV